MKTLRQKLLVSLVVAFMVCASMFCALSFQTAKADVNADLFTIEEGASVAIQKDGLRFRVVMGANVYANVNDGDLKVYVAPKTILEAVTDGNYADLEKKIVFNFAKENIYQRGDLYYANAVLTNLDAENNANITSSQYDLEFAAVAVLDGEATDVVTATQYDVLQKAVISPADEDNAFANAILDAENSPYKNWFGKAEHPIVIDTAEKYADLVSKELETDAVFKVYNKFDFDKADFSANSIFVNYVNFYNDSELLETVEVVEGQTASIQAPVNNKEEAKPEEDAIYHYVFDKWVTENNGEVEADLSAVTDNMSVYASFAKVNVASQLLAEASAADPTTAIFFDKSFGWTALYNKGGNNVEVFNKQYRYHSTRAYGDEEGSSAYVQYNVSKDLHLGYTLAPNCEYTSTDYIVFNVYVECTAADAYVAIRMGSTPGVFARNNVWTTCIFPATLFASTGYMKVSNWSATGSNIIYYFSSAKVVPASEIVNLNTVADDYTYTVGDTALMGKVNRYRWGSDVRTDIAKQDTELYAHYVQGALMTYESTETNRCIGIEFATALTGKVYVTARGIGEKSAPQMQVFTGRESGHKSSPYGTVVKELENGFKVWEFNFSTDAIRYARFYLNGTAFKQIMITNISMTAPAV